MTKDTKDKDKPMGKTVIGSHIVVDGEISGEESLSILGTVKGKITVAQDVVVEEGAKIEASIEAQTLTVSGQLTGNVVVRGRVELRNEAKVVGNIKAPRIVIGEGVSFRGNVDMDV
jgi:cytoskeletal protein CcmA (bactofilin family)